MTSFSQRLITRLLPGRAAEIERESREWMLICQTCGRERSYWDIGGVRYKAKSVGKRTGLPCDICGKRRSHRVERRPGTAPPDPGREAH